MPFLSDSRLCLQLIAISFQWRPQKVKILHRHVLLRLRFLLNRLTTSINVLVIRITTTIFARRVAMAKIGIGNVQNPQYVYLRTISATNVIWKARKPPFVTFHKKNIKVNHFPNVPARRQVVYRTTKARNLVGITKKDNNNPKQSTNFDFCKLFSY